MKAVILAAGEGIRLRPITSTRPKHLVKLGGKAILEHCLETLKASGMRDAIIVTHYMSEAIRRYFGDGNTFGMNLEYVEQPAMLGTGNALSIVEPYLDGDFVLVYGDLLFTKRAVTSVIDLHKKKQPSATLAAVRVERPENYGILRLENQEFVREVIEKPDRNDAPSNWANAGLYMFSMEIFETIQQTNASIRGEWEITDNLSLLIGAKKDVLASIVSKDDWLDVGRPWDLLEANSWVLKRTKPEVKGIVESGAHLKGPVIVEKTARIRSGAYIEGPTFIDEGSDVGPNCYIRACTTIGKNVRVGNACEVKNSILMDGTHVGHLSYVGDSILGEKCNLGAGTKIANYRFDEQTIKVMVKDNLVDTGRKKLGAILGDEVKTGINALLMPGVKIGNKNWVGPNFVVDRDLPAS